MLNRIKGFLKLSGGMSNLKSIQTIGKTQQNNLMNLLYFHKRRIMIGALFCGSYGLLCKKTTNHPVEAIRLGIAGSLANCICECWFHFIDTVNIRAKATDSGKSTYQQVRAIYNKEGVFGFGRGFSACFYGSIFCGFSYFFLYKSTKQMLYQ